MGHWIIWVTIFNPDSRGVAKGVPGRAQAHPNVGCALTMKIEKDQYTLIEQSNNLLKQSMALSVPYQLEILATPLPDSYGYS